MMAVFDTNIVIDALNGVVDAEGEYELYQKVFISNITWMEVLVGARDDEIILRNFLSSYFEILPLDMAIAEEAIKLRREFRLRLPDAIIWATAKTNGAVLVSRNTKDFKADWDGIRIPYK